MFQLCGKCSYLLQTCSKGQLLCNLKPRLLFCSIHGAFVINLCAACVTHKVQLVSHHCNSINLNEVISDLRWCVKRIWIFGGMFRQPNLALRVDLYKSTQYIKLTCVIINKVPYILKILLKSMQLHQCQAKEIGEMGPLCIFSKGLQTMQNLFFSDFMQMLKHLQD